jgi:hypothetical protein
MKKAMLFFLLLPISIIAMESDVITEFTALMDSLPKQKKVVTTLTEEELIQQMIRREQEKREKKKIISRQKKVVTFSSIIKHG